MHFSTKAIHFAQEPDPQTGAVIAPIYITTIYEQEGIGKNKGYEYIRVGNPTRDALEKVIAALENGKYALAFASGLAAESAILHLLKTGDHLFSCIDIYGGTYRLFTQVYANFGISFDFVDLTDLNAVSSAIKDNTRMIWIETPTNPLLRIIDIQAISEIAHKKGVKVVVDNTFATPYLQRPLELGADIVIHSATKYLGGHSDVLGGVVITNDEEIYNRLKFCQYSIGAVLSPIDSYLIMRGIKTLTLRMDKHCQNAREVAEYLKTKNQIKKVFYPGLPGHPGHEIAKRQMYDFGGVISIVVDGDIQRVERFIKGLKLFKFAPSLGGVESLVSHPVSMTHKFPQQQLAGINEYVVRLSVGIEDVRDLIEDLEQSLEKIG